MEKGTLSASQKPATNHSIDDSNNFFRNSGDMMGQLSTELQIRGEAVPLQKSWSRGCATGGS